jgi:hypothetical protein
MIKGVTRVTKMNVLLALEKGERERLHQKLTAMHREAQKPTIYDGLSRTYEPYIEGGDPLASESKKVQVKAADVLRQLADLLARPWDLTASRDATNSVARADVSVVDVAGGTTPLLRAVPATHLLWLEKQLTDMRTFVAKMPVLDPAEQWHYDEALGHYRTDPIQTHRTQRTRRYEVMVKATPEHPAQVDRYEVDDVVGTWSLVKHSGALPWDRQRELLDRIDRLRDAVKAARERANLVEVVDVSYSEAIFSYLLDGGQVSGDRD